MKKTAAGVFALCMLLTACENQNSNIETSVTTAATPAFSVTRPGEISPDDAGMEYDDENDISIYTGREVENEEDLAIFKFSADLPEGYETVIDSAEGKQYVSPNGVIIVKAQNFKEEFQSLEIFADQGCAAIKMNNMMYQADTDFSEPIKTTVAGFDAIMYNYTITSYIYRYETDANGENILNDEGNPILTNERDIYGEYVDRVYYFYSDEDVFYVICESSKEKSKAAAAEFDEFISSVKIEKK